LPIFLKSEKVQEFELTMKSSGNYLILKRFFDISLSFIGLVFSSPLWIIFSFAIFLEDRGPIFYVQERVGKGGRIFQGFKFRSMAPDAEQGIGPVQAVENDPRTTNIGKLLRKTAMDELPQLLNIFKGDMSFVGPRALRPEETELGTRLPARGIFQIPGFQKRSAILPGLTGAAQVFASRNLLREEKFKYDLWYIDNMNFWLDILLILKSIYITLRARWDI
jgi:lipopolysaccharide/colanic/teichoic acid biosynthesis glycosyltransferase